MSSVRLAFSSKRFSLITSDDVVPLSSIGEGAHGRVAGVSAPVGGPADRLIALGVTPGALVTVMQTFPGVVFLCDQTELAVERAVADAILVHPLEFRR
jgi:Fe2+ transport system protein FeoA